MEKYRIMVDGSIQRQSDLALIPPTKENIDYVQYLKDIKNGAELLPYDYETEEYRQSIVKNQIDMDKAKEHLIQEKIREQAIQTLKSENKLDSNENLTALGIETIRGKL